MIGPDRLNEDEAFMRALARRVGALHGAADAQPSLAGRVLGQYRLVREIGRGGMGAVYLAERADDHFEKRVAIKILPLGLSDSLAHERFRVERRILARLEHPGIARLLDGGVSEDGTPYFVMEYVEGERIDRCCARLGVRERLGLFLQVCDAVDYAHRNLVVHRDLKPANILVSTGGDAKLLDFGVARLEQPEPGTGASPLITGPGLPMTLAYASPEQVRGAPVTTATDVYALGMILYELLAGVPPYRVQGVTQESLALICERIPVRPSEAGRGERFIRGDLDSIVMMALRKEPERRYPSVAALADDLRRFLEGRPVAAQADHAAYRFRKFARRRPAAIVGAVATLLGATAFAITQVAHARGLEAERNLAQMERDRAQVQASRAAAVTDFLVGMFESADPAVARGDTLTARALLERGVAQIDALRAEPQVQAEMLATMARAHVALGLYARALPLAERSLKLRTDEESTELAESLHQVGLIRARLGEHATARSHLERALAIRRQLLGNQHPLVALNLVALGGVIRASRTDAEEAEQLLREALAIQRATLGDAHGDLAPTLEELSTLAAARGDAVLSDSLRRWAAGVREATMGDDPLALATVYTAQATRYRTAGDANAAEDYYRRALGIRRRILGDHPLVAASLGNVALVLRTGNAESRGRAEIALREAVTIGRRFAADDPTGAVGNLLNLAGFLHGEGRPAEAERLLREAIGMERNRGVSPDFPMLRQLGFALVDQGKGEQARPILAEALALGRARLGEAPHPSTAVVQARLGSAQRQAGRLREAESSLRAAIADLRYTLRLEPDARRTTEVGRGARSLPDARYGADGSGMGRGERELREQLAHSLHDLGDVLRRTNRLEDAANAIEEALSIRKGLLGAESRDALTSRVLLEKVRAEVTRLR